MLRDDVNDSPLITWCCVGRVNTPLPDCEKQPQSVNIAKKINTIFLKDKQGILSSPPSELRMPFLSFFYVR
jgi:hypothetical protein